MSDKTTPPTVVANPNALFHVELIDKDRLVYAHMMFTGITATELQLPLTLQSAGVWSVTVEELRDCLTAWLEEQEPSEAANLVFLRGHGLVPA